MDIKKLIKHMLTYFDSDEPRKIILLASTAYRRVCKMMSVFIPEITTSAETKHLLTRWQASEFSWRQIFSSPEGNLIRDFEHISMIATANFVKRFTEKEYKFKTALARHHLNELWSTELSVFDKYPNYLQLMKERDYGELHPTEAIDIVYDDLAHGCLCVLKKHPKWKKYVLENHHDLVIDTAALGSWSAQDMVGHCEKPKEILDFIRAQRFFFGNKEIYTVLSKNYGYTSH